MGNCFRFHGVVYNVAGRDLVQFSGTGTLFGVLAQIMHYTNRLRDPIQLLVIEEVLNEGVCVEDAVLHELSLAHGGDVDVNLDELERELRNTYDEFFRREYEAPKVRLEYDEHDGVTLKRIIIEQG